MKLAYNVSQANGSSTMFLRKAHVKLCLQVDKSGRIPIKKWVSLTRHEFHIVILSNNVYASHTPRMKSCCDVWAREEEASQGGKVSLSHLAETFFYWFCNQPFLSLFASAFAWFNVGGKSLLRENFSLSSARHKLDWGKIEREISPNFSPL